MKIINHEQQLANIRRQFLESVDDSTLDMAIEMMEQEEIPEQLIEQSLEIGWRWQLIWLLERKLNKGS